MADAARAALAEGIEGLREAVTFIKTRFGIDMNPQHFSATKSLIKKKERESQATAKKASPAKKRAPAIEGHLAPSPASAASGEFDLLDVMESMKPLIARYGAERVKRIVDLLG